MSHHGSKGLAGFIRRSTVLQPHKYSLERDGVRLSSCNDVATLLKHVAEKGAGCRIVRRDGVVVWPVEEAKGFV